MSDNESEFNNEQIKEISSFENISEEEAQLIFKQVKEYSWLILSFAMQKKEPESNSFDSKSNN